jgi:uncharacterized membrane protein (UPF0127 family)
MKRSDLVFLVIVLLVFLCGVVIWGVKHLSAYPQNPQYLNYDVPVGERPIRVLSLNGTPIRAEVVYPGPDTQRGLGGRSQMPLDEGMLFELQYEDIHSFWMKDMLIPIDIIWINGDKVVEMAEYLPPPRRYEVPVTHTPSALANRVLEVNAGMVESTGLKVGDRIGGIDAASSLY